MALKYYESRRGHVAYQKRGWGDPLLLVHGIYPGASHEEFARNIPALARHFTVYAIDLLGFGHSDMPRATYTVQTYQHLLRDFIVEEVGGPAHLMASGVSCGFAVALAVYNDAMIGKLVLIDPICDESQIDQPPSMAAKVQQFLLGTLSLGSGLYETLSSKFELRRFLRSRYANPRCVSEDRVEELHRLASRRHALHGFISHMTGHLSMDVARWLRYVRSSVLILWGQDAGPAPTARLLRQTADGSDKRVHIIERAAHWPHDEQSAKVNTLVIDFLNGQ